MKRLDEYWYSQNPVAWLLLPLALIFCLISLCRRFLYRINLFTVTKIPVPVVVVGNITVGGTGKTPLLIALVKILQHQGFKPGVISRGYGGQATEWPQIVHADSSADQVGDEPLMIARRTKCPVVVGPDRVRDAGLLLDRHDCNIILSDDGLQHYRLHRDMEIAVVDAERKTGNGFCLPAGPLREIRHRLNTVDIVILNGGPGDEPSFALQPGNLTSLNGDRQISLDSFRGKTVHAVAGIGHPERFFKSLELHGIQVIKHGFPDHHDYVTDDLAFNDDLAILMTEKDAVKCQRLNTANSWYLPVEAVLSKQAQTKFQQLIEQVCNG